ncbi:hypothetical protein [Streptomyces sp. NPDC006875]|uniref:hypothetical protein n=1 Tax=Streptomyces sp. NPDC006875 TaxID=3154781 RepID=UPI0033DE6B52
MLGVTDAGSTEEETPDGLLGWCLVANVARETSHGESGLDIQHGTKHFRAGTLLWIPPAIWDPGDPRRHAVGRHRGNSRRYVNMVVHLEDLENFRVKAVYSEALVRSLNGYGHDPAAPRTLQNPWTHEHAQSWADSWNRHLEPLFIEGHPYAHPRISVPNPPPAEIQLNGETLHLAHYGTTGAHYSRTPPPTERIPEP